MGSEPEPKSAKPYQVFLSYSSADKEAAQRIMAALRQRGVSVWADAYELQYGDSIADAIGETISASDYLVVLLSPNSVNSKWVQRELAAALSSDLSARDITLLPVLIADCEIPPTLANYQHLDLRKSFEVGVDQLVEQIEVAPEIDFSQLDGSEFEGLVADLLTELGFEDVEREWAVRDYGVDIKASYSHTDPFKARVTETWVVEIKFYRQGRADLKSVHQLVNYMSGLPARTKGLLVTNGQLTSAAREWLNSAEESGPVAVRVLDGTELKRLLLQKKHLVEKYFVHQTGR